MLIADWYLARMSPRRMDRLVEQLVIHSLSMSQVSRIAAELDVRIDRFRRRFFTEVKPLTSVSANAMTKKVRGGGPAINIAILVPTGVDGDGRRWAR
jgi:putative transposase